MHKLLLAAAPLALLATPAQPQASADLAAGRTTPSALAPGEIVAAAPAAEWVAIAPSDLLVMQLTPDAKGKPRRVVIQLMPPPFSQGWIGNIRKLAAAHWWDGLSINRVQDNYVVQWGDADGEDAKKARALPPGLAVVPESEYVSAYNRTMFSKYGSDGFKHVPQGRDEYRDFARDHVVGPEGRPPHFGDPYSGNVAFASGFPVGLTWWVKRDSDEIVETGPEQVWPVHCYGMVGVGRDLSPNTGSGAELYVVIGHAPRHLDRNIALVGRVIEGIEHLSSLPRGTGGLGFYETAEERTGIASIRLGSHLAPAPDLKFEYLSTTSESFARYANARANRRDPFFIRPAGGADICNIPVPVRRAK